LTVDAPRLRQAARWNYAKLISWTWRIIAADGNPSGGVGIIPFFAWLIALAILALGRGILPPSIGWLSLGFLGLTVAVLAVSALTYGPPLWVATVALVVVIGALFVALATTMASTADRLVTG